MIYLEFICFNIWWLGYGSIESYLVVLMWFFFLKFVVIEVVEVNFGKVNYKKLKVVLNRLYYLYFERVGVGMRVFFY